jgi:hypothetical protein
MTRPRAGLLVLGFRRLVWAGDVYAPAFVPCGVRGDRRRYVGLAAGNPPLLIAALQHDRHAARRGSKIAGVTTTVARIRPGRPVQSISGASPLRTRKLR